MADPKEIRQKLIVDTGDSVSEIKAVEAAAGKADKAIDDIDDRELEFDTGQGMARLKELQAEIKRIKEESVTIKAELDARGMAAEAKQEIDKIDTTVDVGFDVDHGSVNTTTTAINDVFSEIGAGGASTAIGISQAFNDAAEQAIAAFGENSAIARALTALGPLGTAALGAAAGGLLFWWQQIKSAQEKAAESVREYIGLLEEASGSTSQAALRKVLDEFSDPGELKAINALGLTFTDLADVVSGKTVPKFEELLDVQKRLTDGGVSKAEAQQIQAAGGIVNFDKLLNSLRDEESELRKGIQAYLDKQQIVQRTIEQLGGLKAAYDALPSDVGPRFNAYVPAPPGSPYASPGTTVNNYYPASASGESTDRSLQDYYKRNGQG